MTSSGLTRARSGQRCAGAAFEVALAPRVELHVSVCDGFVVTLWTYYEAVPPHAVTPAEYADALNRLHAGMRQIDITPPHFADCVAAAQALVASRDHTPALADTDRTLLSIRMGAEQR